MPIDASIYSQFAPAAKSARDFQNDDLERQTRIQGIESNKLALQGQRQKQAEYERATQEQAENNNLLQRYAQESGGDQRRFVSLLRGSGRAALMAQGDARERAMLDGSKVEAETKAKQAESLGKLLTAQGDLATRVFANPTRESAASALANMKALAQTLGIPLDFAGDDAALQQFQTPEQIKAWASGHALKAKELLPQIQQFSVGNAQVTQAVDPITGRPVETGRVAIERSPDNIATVGATIRGQNFVNDRAIEAQRVASGAATAEAGGPSQAEFTRQFGKAAPGYRWKADGSQEAIPGGPADRKNTDAGIREARQREASVAQADRVIAKVDQALADVGVTTAGPGSILTGIPGTTARNLDSTLQTIKSNLGFAELQAMRDASPTGGALGAIAVQELMALQATVASLDQGQSPTQLRKSLNDIRKHYSNWKDAVSGKTPAAPGAPKPSTGGKTVTLPDGRVLAFPTEKAAADFKKDAGL